MAIEIYKPLVWMQSISTSVNYLRFIVKLPIRETINLFPDDPVSVDETRGMKTLEFSLIFDDSINSEHDVEVSYELRDPYFEDIVVVISDNSDPLNKIKKGQGTTQQSEGDTSGEG